MGSSPSSRSDEASPPLLGPEEEEMDTYRSSGLALLLLAETEAEEADPGSKGLAFGFRSPAEGSAGVLLPPGEVARLRPCPCP